MVKSINIQYIKKTARVYNRCFRITSIQKWKCEKYIEKNYMAKYREYRQSRKQCASKTDILKYIQRILCKN